MASLSDDANFQAGQDAQTLQDHSAITGDPKRHKAAMAKLQDKHDAVKTALKDQTKRMHGRVKAGLQKAFPKDSDTPFQKAGGTGIKGAFTKPNGKAFTEPDEKG